VEDNVTHFGETAHSYRIPGSMEEWDNSPQPSAIIRSRSVVGQNALIIGPVSIGPGAYVSAGEIVRCDVPEDSVFWRGSIKPISDFRGFIQVRSD
jgi:acetyltransferase-like isoleucine patch superfamily enzyme